MRLAILLALAACSGSMPAAPVDAARDVAIADSAPRRRIAYVSGYGPDIAWLDVAGDGTLAPRGSIAAFAAGPSFLAIDPSATHLYAVSETTSQVGAYAIDPATGALTFLATVASGGNGPAHLSVDRAGRHVLVANYGDGKIAVLPIAASGALGAATLVLAAGTNAHEIVTDAADAHVLVPCLGSDYVAQYAYDDGSGALTANGMLAVASGSGPRHVALAPSGDAAFLLEETASQLASLHYDAATGRLTAIATYSTRSAGATGANTGAEVWVHPSGQLVYATNRGDDTIARFRINADDTLALLDETPTGGATPRDFTLDRDGTHLYVANQNGNNVVAFAIAADGALTPIGSPIAATSPSFVGIVELP